MKPSPLDTPNIPHVIIFLVVVAGSEGSRHCLRFERVLVGIGIARGGFDPTWRTKQDIDSQAIVETTLAADYLPDPSCGRPALVQPMLDFVRVFLRNVADLAVLALGKEPWRLHPNTERIPRVTIVEFRPDVDVRSILAELSDDRLSRLECDARYRRPDFSPSGFFRPIAIASYIVGRPWTLLASLAWRRRRRTGEPSIVGEAGDTPAERRTC